jgi:transcriptional regulator with XRE-family HTH domain
MAKLLRAQRVETHLSRFLVQTRKANKLTIRQSAAIASVPSSVFAGWEKGASPSLDSIPGVKRFCDHFKVSLSFALTGELDATMNAEGIEGVFHEQEFFDGYARIKIMRLLPKSEVKKKEPS